MCLRHSENLRKADRQLKEGTFQGPQTERRRAGGAARFQQAGEYAPKHQASGELLFFSPDSHLNSHEPRRQYSPSAHQRGEKGWQVLASLGGSGICKALGKLINS